MPSGLEATDLGPEQCVDPDLGAFSNLYSPWPKTKMGKLQPHETAFMLSVLCLYREGTERP